MSFLSLLCCFWNVKQSISSVINNIIGEEKEQSVTINEQFSDTWSKLSDMKENYKKEKRKKEMEKERKERKQKADKIREKYNIKKHSDL